MKPSRRSRSSSPAKSPRGPIRSPRVAAYPWQGATRSPSTGNSSPRSGFGPYPYKDLASPPSPQRDGSPTRKPARARPARARSPTTEPLAVSDQIHDDQRGRRPVIEPDRRTPSRSPSPWRIHPGSPNSGNGKAAASLKSNGIHGCSSEIDRNPCHSFGCPDVEPDREGTGNVPAPRVGLGVSPVIMGIAMKLFPGHSCDFCQAASGVGL